jgi:predicted transposase/invertase (TIGR01784 family)
LKTDSIFYRIFSTSPGILFELLGRPPSLAQEYEFRSVEVKQVAFRLDGVLLPKPDAPDQTVWFVEVQFQRDPTFYQRFFAEIYLYLNLYPQTVDWQAVVVFPNRSIEPEDLHLYRANLNSDQVHRVYLEDFRDTSSESVGISLMQLIMSNSADAIPKAKELLSRTQPLSKTDAKFAAIIELIETIVVYKFPSLSREAIEKMLGLSELRQTKVYQEALEEGIAEGEQRGRTEEARSLVLRLLTRKFGSISSDIEAQVQALALAQIEALGEALLDFSQLSDLIAWLVGNK